ncbi:uncharacterized protein LOC143300498 isoform X2 [Babylonia areolata]|uniref:uncharacterized protein LOC143300498 isoform X2 n=1 Tax=Babylonia areolata TaxID=304850 RepID=UPI003FD41505
MATTQAFLKETVLQNRFIRPGVVKVVLHVDGPLEDGSMVKEVADSTVYMKAIFTQQSLDTFHTSFEDSFNSPPEWSQALLLLNQFHVEFQPASLPSNTEKRPRFVLMVERFGLYNLHEGFYSKNQPKDLMADPEVRAKAEEMEKDFVGQDEDVHSQDCSDVAVSVLLEQMGQSSIGDLTAIVSQCEQEDSNPTEPRRDAVNIVHTWQSALDKMRCLDLEDFMVSAEEQAVLDSVPEWKDSYIPPASDSSEDQQWKTSMGVSLDIAFEGPTLQQESCQALRHIPPTSDQHTPDQEDNSSEADNRKTKDIPAGTDNRKTKDIPVGTVNRKVEEVPTGNEESASVCKETDANSLTTSAAHAENRAAKAGVEEEEGRVVVVEPDTEAEKRLTGKKGPAHSQPPSLQHDSVAWQPAPDCLGSSTSSLDSSAHQPDLSFTISSMSNCENSTSLGEDPSSVCADAACQPAEPFSPSCEVHDAAAAGAVHESQNDKQQRQNQLNTDFATGDKAENGLTVTSLHIACQSASADSTNLDREKGSDVSTTQPEQVKRVESGCCKNDQPGK